MTRRAGRPAPAHYGSAAGELAVCMAGVGLADRSDLAVLSIAASRRGLDHLLARVLGRGVAPGGAALEAGSWWCRSASADEVMVIHPYAVTPRLNVHRFTGATLTDLSESRFVLNVIGRRTGAVLTDLGVKDTAPFVDAPIDGRRVSWLLETTTSAIGIVDGEDAGEVWLAVEAAGRPHGISCVGLDSVERYLLAQRAKRMAANCD
jgi:sarcosine oxidase gamma subunit